MQLILTQNDIEQALKNYVNDLINIKEGMVITVDLKATRGADGATAIIDISPAAAEVTEAVVAKVVSKPKAVVTEAKPKAAAAVVVKVEPEVLKDEGEPWVDPRGESVEEEVIKEGIEEEVEPEPEVIEETEAEEVPPVAAPKNSLFAGLQRPKNK